MRVRVVDDGHRGVGGTHPQEQAHEQRALERVLEHEIDGFLCAGVLQPGTIDHTTADASREASPTHNPRQVTHSKRWVLMWLLIRVGDGST